jgi:uncharacterized membrane protein HdeD (DUF308 family)
MSRTARFGPDLLAVGALAVACAVCVYVPGTERAQAPFGVLLALGGIGYAVACALWGRHRPDWTEMLLYSLALSLAATVVIAVGVDLAGAALTRRTLVGALVALTLIAVGVAWVRRPEVAGSAARLGSWLAIGAVPVIVFAAAVTVLRRPIANDKVAGYTQLWSTRAGSGKIKVGLASAEQRPTRYVLRVAVAGSRPISRSVRLDTGQSWSRELPAVPAARRAAVKVSLYRANELTRPYRTVSLAP